MKMLAECYNTKSPSSPKKLPYISNKFNSSPLFHLPFVLLVWLYMFWWLMSTTSNNNVHSQTNSHNHKPINHKSQCSLPSNLPSPQPSFIHNRVLTNSAMDTLLCISICQRMNRRIFVIVFSCIFWCARK